MPMVLTDQEVYRSLRDSQVASRRNAYIVQCQAWLREALISTKVPLGQLPDIEDTLEDQDELLPLAAFDYEQFRVLIRRYTPGKRLTAKNDIRHEAVHVRRFLLNKVLYRRIRQKSGAGHFLLAVHDTLLNPLEIEARVFELTGILTDAAVDPWLTGSPCPLEELISHPLLAAELLQQYPGYELNNRQKNLLVELQQLYGPTGAATKTLGQIRDRLAETLKASVSALQETLRSNSIDDISLFLSLFVQRLLR